MSLIPAELRFAESHEWARLEADGTVTVGISDHAQEALGDVVFVELAEVGKVFAAGDTAGVVESVKAASDIYSLGCLMTTVVTGHPPFPGESPIAVARAQVYDTPTPLSQLRADCPPALDALVAAEHPAVDVDDLARRGGGRVEPGDDVGIFALRHEADVLAVLLGCDGQPHRLGCGLAVVEEDFLVVHRHGATP